MKKTTIIIVHGAYGYPEENWFGWMKQELLKEGLHCEVPSFPTPRNQRLKKWLTIFDQRKETMDSKTILVGHSLGAAFILRWLELHRVQIKAAILVGAFLGEVGNPSFDSINKDFFLKPFQWPQIRERSAQFLSYYGQGDPYISRSHFDFIAKQLQAKKIIISQAGHFNLASGYTQFPQLLLQLKNMQEQA